MNARRVVTGSPLTLPSPLGGERGSRAVALHLSELGAAYLAADGFRKVRDELDLARVLVGRRHGLDMLLELSGERVRRGVTGGENHEGLDDLAAEGVGLADDGGLGDGGVLDQGRLDLEGADTVRRAVDHVVRAADEPEIAVLVHGRAVAGDVPVATVAFRGGVGVLPVLLEHADGPLGLDEDAEIALLAARQLAPVFIHDADAVPRRSRAHGAGFPRRGRERRGHQHALGLTVALVDVVPRALTP